MRREPPKARERRIGGALACLAGLLAPLATILAMPAPAARVHHPVSTSVVAAQAAFDRGLTLVYAYDEVEGERAFRRAARLDPGLAMAWWGVALALGPDINQGPEPGKTARAARAIEQARRLVGHRGSAAERDYIEALAARYASASQPDFDALALGYRDRSRELMRRYPDDPDAAALFAEAQMELHPWRLWTADGRPAEGTDELVAAIEGALTRHPDHLGLLHYYIHAVEASEHPERALEGARRLAALPFESAAAHLVHMPAHTFLRVGDWGAAIACNEHAVEHALAFRRSTEPHAQHACSHCLRFLAYAYSMQGNFAGARRAAEAVRAMHGDPTELILVLERFARYDELLAMPEPSSVKTDDGGEPHVIRATWRYGRAVARLGTNDLDGTATELAGLSAEAGLAPPQPSFATDRPDIAHVYDQLSTAIDAGVLRIEEQLLTGRLALAHGDPSAAITAFNAAIAIQDSMQYSEPPPWLYPIREVLAATLMKTGAHAAAVEVLRECLRRTPHDPRATLALREALRATGNAVEAALLDPEIAAAAEHADGPLVEAGF